MNGLQRIVVCGTSIFVAAIESGLDAMGIGEVLGFNPQLPNALARITNLAPHVIVMETDPAGDGDELAQAFVCQGFPVILLDVAQRKIITLPGKYFRDTEVSEASMDQLIQVIKDITAGGHVHETWPLIGEGEALR